MLGTCGHKKRPESDRSGKTGPFWPLLVGKLTGNAAEHHAALTGGGITDSSLSAAKP
ncbi:MAG: hypothetical protein HYS45_01965 [Parcubacteria group bacterium]|nr:hypothetical protein [Parcubacteria group bacterium]